MSRAKSPVFLLVNGSMRAGGIESLILRLISWLRDRNRDVILLLTNPDGNETFHKNPVPFMSLLGADLRLSDSLIEKIKSMDGREFTILSFDSGSAAAGSILERHLVQIGAVHSHVSGVFHPRAYFMDAEPRFRRFLNWIIGNSFPPHLLLFMNEETLSSHSAFFKRNLSSALTAHIPLSETKIQKFTKDVRKFKIITIGRLVDFKAYNVGIAHNANLLRAAGIDFVWEVFGEGPLRKIMESEIRSHNLQDHVILRGNINYDEIPPVIISSDIFVGHGTSALEAAQHGVPAICCTVDSKLTSHGFIHDLPLGNVGEVLPGRANLLVSDMILSFVGMGLSGRRDLSRASIRYSEEFSFNSFVSKLDGVERRRARTRGLVLRSSIGIFLLNLHTHGSSSLKSLVYYCFTRPFS